MSKFIAISVVIAALAAVSARDEPISENRQPKVFFNRGWGWKKPIETVYITYPKKGWGWEGGYGGGGGGHGGGWGWPQHHPYDDHHPIHVFGKHKQQGWGGWGGWGGQGGGGGFGGGGFGGGGFGGSGGYGGWGGWGGGGGGYGGKKGGKKGGGGYGGGGYGGGYGGGGKKGGKKGGGGGYGGYERAIAGPGPVQFVRVPVSALPPPGPHYDDDIPTPIPVGVPVQSVYGEPEPFYDDPYEFDGPSPPPYYDDAEYFY